MDGLYPFKELHCHVAERNDGVLVQFKLIAVAKVMAAFGTDELARLQLLVGLLNALPLEPVQIGSVASHHRYGHLIHGLPSFCWCLPIV